MRVVVDRFEDQTQYLLDDLVQRGRNAERPLLAIGLGDVNPSSWLELEALVSKARGQIGDDLEREAIERLAVTSRSHVAGLGLDPLVSHFIQLGTV